MTVEKAVLRCACKHSMAPCSWCRTFNMKDREMTLRCFFQGVSMCTCAAALLTQALRLTLLQ